MEQGFVQARLIEKGVQLVLAHRLEGLQGDELVLNCVYSANERRVELDKLILVTMRDPNDELYVSLETERDTLESAGIKTVHRIGDCLAPGLLAAAVYGGHKYARVLDDAPATDEPPFKRELVELSECWPP